MSAGNRLEPASPAQRLTWARMEWQRDLAIPVAGPGGMIERMNERFGAAASVDALRVIFNEEKAKRPHGVPRATTSLGAKLQAAVAATENASRAPEPPAKPTLTRAGTPRKTPEEVSAAKREAFARRPPGANSQEMVQRRRQFARDLLRHRPNIRYGGEDGADELLVKTFGSGITPKVFEDIRREVLAERDAAGLDAAPPATPFVVQTSVVAQGAIPPPFLAPPLAVEPREEPLPAGTQRVVVRTGGTAELALQLAAAIEEEREAKEQFAAAEAAHLQAKKALNDASYRVQQLMKQLTEARS